MFLKNCFFDINFLVGMGESILELFLLNRKVWRFMDIGLFCSNFIIFLFGLLFGLYSCTLVFDSLDSKWLLYIMFRL